MDITMKTSLKTGCVILFITIIIGCSSNTNIKQFSDRLNVTDGVDMWNSIHYEIISDIDTIKAFEPSTNEGSLFLHFLIKLENRGEERAESFSVTFNESIPFKYIDGSSHQGIDHGYLDGNEDYEVYGHYTFSSITDVEEFIDHSNLTIEWDEAGKNKELILKFPSKPTQ
jgi:hypothetical protein